jgi:crotonobetainyl-CoA:carnitine CoA-transferase CaiB-like acyl-CoA transferase
MGADVVKIESLAFPDGMRQSYLPIGLSVGFGAGHRNKRSLGLNLKSAEGKALFRKLVAQADVVLSNFKPGTMAALGFAPEALAAINPRIVLVESSAYGDSGPWSARMGYGPLVRAAAGLTRKWRYADDPEGFADSITIYPDHVAARLGAMGAVALLIRRLRTGRGGRVSISQAEVMLAQLGTEIAGTALGLPGIEQAPDAPWGVWQAAGEDEWCVVTVRNDADWAALVAVIGDAALVNPRFATRAGRLAARDALSDYMAQWLRQQDAEAAMHRLQTAGVPAARMLRVAEQPGFPYFAEREFFRTEVHPHMAETLISERVPVRSEALPEPPASPAPLMGEHTFAVMQDWLGLDEAELDRLAADGVLEPVSPNIRALIEAGKH